MENDVDIRAQQLFKLLVEHYIADGTPGCFQGFGNAA